jgi:hypothetical protein
VVFNDSVNDTRSVFIADVKNVEIINKCRLFLKFNELIHEWSEEKITNIPQKLKI